MNYADKYFDVNRLVNDYLRKDLIFKKPEDELNHLKNAKAILGCEVLTLYDFLDRRHLLTDYKKYINGDDEDEDLPFK